MPSATPPFRIYVKAPPFARQCLAAFKFLSRMRRPAASLKVRDTYVQPPGGHCNDPRGIELLNPQNAARVSNDSQSEAYVLNLFKRFQDFSRVGAPASLRSPDGMRHQRARNASHLLAALGARAARRPRHPDDGRGVSALPSAAAAAPGRGDKD